MSYSKKTLSGKNYIIGKMPFADPYISCVGSMAEYTQIILLCFFSGWRKFAEGWRKQTGRNNDSH